MTNGQRLYEYENPKYIQVVETRHVFNREQHAFYILNPKHIADYSFLTEKTIAAYEKRSIGHHIFS